MNNIQYRYYLDVNGDGLIYEVDGDRYIGDKNAAPKDAGDYILVLDYKGSTYEAYTAVAFEIRKRPIEIMSVENWLNYLETAIIRYLNNSNQPAHLKTYPLMEPDSTLSDEEKAAFIEAIKEFKQGGWKDMFGTVYFSNVVEGDVVELSDKVYAYYNEITISYNASKITLRYDAYKDANGDWHGYQIDWLADKAGPDANGQYANDNRNYELTGVSNFRHSKVENAQGELVDNPNPLDFSYVHLAGMLSYLSEGAIFRKEDGDVAWDKYWPTNSDHPLNWDENGQKDKLGNYITPDITEEGIDFESPSNASHQKHVFVKTQNADRIPKFSFDVEYGSMEFVYAKAVWDPLTYEYVETEKSDWVTNDGVTNKITIVNRSDAAIDFSSTVSVNSVAAYGVTIGYLAYPSIEDANAAGVKEGNQDITLENWSAPQTYQGRIESAVDNGGKPRTEAFYLIVDGEAPKSSTKTTVGTLFITISPVV